MVKSHVKISSCIVASAFGSESKLTTSQPLEAKTDPTKPVPENNSSERITGAQKKVHFLGFGDGSFWRARGAIFQVVPGANHQRLLGLRPLQGTDETETWTKTPKIIQPNYCGLKGKTEIVLKVCQTPKGIEQFCAQNTENQ